MARHRGSLRGVVRGHSFQVSQLDIRLRIIPPALLVATVAFAVAGVLEFQPPVLAPLTLTYLLVAPGLSLLLAIWPDARHATVETPLRLIVFAFLLSLILSPGVSLLLTQTGIGLSLRSSTVLLASLVTGASAVAIFRSRGRAGPHLKFHGAPVNPWAVGAVTIALLSAGAAAVVAANLAEAESFTEFAILDGEGAIPSAPVALEAGTNASLSIVVTARGEGYAYRIHGLAHRTDGKTDVPIVTISGTAIDGERTTHTVHIELEDAGRYNLVFTLIRLDDEEGNYRQTNIWVDVE